MNTVIGIFSLVGILISIDMINKYVDVEAVKRILSTIIDTLSKEKATTLIAGIGAIVYCCWVVYLVMGVGYEY